MNKKEKEKKVKEFMKQLTKALEYTSKMEKILKEYPLIEVKRR